MEKNIGITVKKDDDISEWFTQLMTKAELADVRYKIKGLPVYREWAALSIRKERRLMEEILERKGHLPLLMPTLIPESNFHVEAEHVEGFTPEVFWVTEHGDSEKFDERMALRPTSETAFYQMYAYWIRSHKDLPYKRYQGGSVFRYEGKATRPFLRTREMHWIETHCAFASKEDSEKQILEDVETTREFLMDRLAIPHIFFERPQWDKFAGADKTCAADALMPSGKVSQLPSTHMLGTRFAKAFGVEFTDKDKEKKHPYLNCYGPCFSRIYGALIMLHGDDKGLVLPWDIAPHHVVVVPIIFEDSKDKVLAKAEELKDSIIKSGLSAFVDAREDYNPGWKFNQWEMKGVPIRIEVGPKDLESGSVMMFRRDLGSKDKVAEGDVVKRVKEIAGEFTKNLAQKKLDEFKDNTVDVSDMDAAKKAIETGKMLRTGFCSIGMDGAGCAEIVEKDVGEVRGVRIDKDEKPSGKCLACDKDATEVVYIAKSY